MLANATKSHVVNRKPYKKLKTDFDDDVKRELHFVDICHKDVNRIKRNERIAIKKEKKVEKQL